MTEEFISAWNSIIDGADWLPVDQADELFDLAEKHAIEREKSANCMSCEHSASIGQHDDFMCIKDKSYFCADFVTENNTCEYFERVE